jgi:general secretion pathway protein E
VDLAESQSAITMAAGMTREYLSHHRVCPLAVTANGELLLGAAPTALLADAIDDVEVVYKRSVLVESRTEADIDRLIEHLNSTDRGDGATISLEGGATEGDDSGTTDVRDLANQPPVVRYVNLLVQEAYESGASDIHLEATRLGLTARLRLDGILTTYREPAPALALAVASRIKLLAELDIAERRRPQDGRIRVRLEARELDLRVSTVPTLFGESIVLRLLDRGGRPVSLPQLGMPDNVLAAVEQLAALPHGMILVTGPTGSGKTTTLYAALQLRRTIEEKIITVEDPVEYELAGITQMPVQRQAGVTFAAALRSILRQDPDVVMLGEMRDSETAEIAIQAAMTGHLVLSTLHTNDAVSAVPRLVDLGVPPYLLVATLEGVLAQRLVRAVCDQCWELHRPDEGRIDILRSTVGEAFEGIGASNATRFTRGRGCPACRNTGYRGRIGIFELMVMTDELRDAIGRNATRAELRVLSRRSGMQSLVADGWFKVCAGVTTLDEVLRVVQRQ